MSEIVTKKISSHLHPTPSWDLDFHQMPSSKEEQWRFSPVRRLAGLFSNENAKPASWDTKLPENVSEKLISFEQAKELSWDPPVDLVTANAVRGAKDEVKLIEIPAETELAEPLYIQVHGDNETLRGHLIIKAGHHAKGTILLRYTGVANFAAKVEVHAADGSDLMLISVQDWDQDAMHGYQISTLVGADAKVRSFQASIGKGIVRVVENARFEGEGGDISQLGMYFVQANQHVEHRMFINHQEPHTFSHVDYRGALQGKGSHSVWIGDVLIGANAKDIETYETNKNLMLTEGCQADSVPNLEIETGEIRGAGHASSTGRFDEDQLFYLCSRGIAEARARRLVVEGFFLDIIHRIGLEEVEHRLIDALNEQLAGVEGMEAESVLARHKEN